MKLLLGVGSQHDPYIVITQTDEAWAFHGSDDEWTHIGPFPGGPVAPDQEFWGKVKTKHRQQLLRVPVAMTGARGTEPVGSIEPSKRQESVIKKRLPVAV